MAPSSNELSSDHKIVFLLESLVEKQDQKTPIACSLCDQIFLENKELVNHFQSHFHRDGTLISQSLVGRFISAESGTSFFSCSSEHTHSFSMPVNVCKSVAKENLGPCNWQNLSPNQPNLSLGIYQVPTLSQDFLQLKEPTLTHGHQSYSSPSAFHSAISHTFAPQPIESPNFHSTFALQSTGPQNFYPSVEPITPGIFTTQTTNLSKLCLPMGPGSSTSQPIPQSSICSPIRACAFASQSIPGSGNLPLGTTTRCLPQAAMRNELAGAFTGYTKPYIMQLERPGEEMKAGRNYVGGNDNPDVMDLTLKL